MRKQLVRPVMFIVALALGLLVQTAGPAGAAGLLRVDVDYTLVSVAPDPSGSILTIVFKGVGTSAQLGGVTVDTVISQQISDTPCVTATANHTFTASGGTLKLVGHDHVCGSRIFGVWNVVGGSGSYLAAGGTGVIRATTSHQAVSARFTGVLLP
jgi:hypothetical protein